MNQSFGCFLVDKEMSEKQIFAGPQKRRGVHDLQKQDNATPSPEVPPNSTSSDCDGKNTRQLTDNENRPQRAPKDNSQTGLVEEFNESAQLTDDEGPVERARCESKEPEEPEVEIPEFQSNLETHPEPHGQLKVNANFRNIAVAAVVVVFIGVFLGMWFLNTESNPFLENILELHSKYPNTDDMLWPTLIVGVNRSVYRNPGEPATFIFLYNSSNVVQSLLDDVTRITTDCFRTGGAIWRTSKDFQSAEITQDYGIVLERYRKELISKGVLVVRDLDRVPPTAANIFFTICDSYEPLVHKAVIFFTIDISRQPKHVVHPERSATSIAEEILKDSWREELKPNTLDPLVVRLTENVFRID